ncbi:MAG: hypothetical protein IJ010_02555 [Ruminococcus sp.]|nr:hypothetical protein [Ruminococcus sp.]
MSKKKVTLFILCICVVIGVFLIICIIRENKLRRASLSIENLTFDNMEFVRCNDYELTNNLKISEIICKTTDGDWCIFSVENYEYDYEYVYVQLTCDGYFYERIK